MKKLNQDPPMDQYAMLTGKAVHLLVDAYRGSKNTPDWASGFIQAKVVLWKSNPHCARKVTKTSDKNWNQTNTSTFYEYGVDGMDMDDFVHGDTPMHVGVMLAMVTLSSHILLNPLDVRVNAKAVYKSMGVDFPEGALQQCIRHYMIYQQSQF